MASITKPRTTLNNEEWDDEMTHVTEEVYMRLAFLKTLSEFNGRQVPRANTSDQLAEARRNFLDRFAYLCDVKKGGATVTAAALEKLAKGNLLWLAANEGIAVNIKEYAGRIIRLLQSLSEARDGDDINNVTDSIFTLAIQEGRARIQEYRELIAVPVRNTRMQLRKAKSSTSDARLAALITTLRKALGKIDNPPSNNADLVLYCYELRATRLKDLNEICKNDDMKSLNRTDFEGLAHLIWRLGAVRDAAQVVVKSMLTVPSLRKITGVRCVDNSISQNLTFTYDGTSPYEFVRDLCEKSDSLSLIDCQRALHQVVELDLPTKHGRASGPAPPLRALFQTNHRATKTVVHAELQLADQISRKGKDFNFVDRDKYIGCSKPACYFCFNWLSGHIRGYVPPATHNKIILGCRGPDNNLNENGRRHLLDMYKRLCTQIGKDILANLLETENEHPTNVEKRRRQYQSTHGASFANSMVSI